MMVSADEKYRVLLLDEHGKLVDYSRPLESLERARSVSQIGLKFYEGKARKAVILREIEEVNEIHEPLKT